MNMKVPVCENHLSELYEAIKVGDLGLMAQVEHELTEEEKCVACAYVFKTHGTVREALEEFLNNEGMHVGVAPEPKNIGEYVLVFWGLRLGLLSVILGVNLSVMAVLKYFLFGVKQFSLLPFTIIEFTLVGLASLVIFLLVDDMFFE